MSKRRFESIFFLDADEAACAPYNPRIRPTGNGDAAMENQPAARAAGKPHATRAPVPSTRESRRQTEESRHEEEHAPSAARRMALLGEEFLACQALLCALGNECQQAIFLDLLRNWGGLRTCEIAEHVGLSRPSVSHHLGIMKKAGIVSVERIGTVRVYHPSESTRPWRALSQLAWNAYRFVEDEASEKTCPKAHTDARRQAGKDDRWT